MTERNAATPFSLKSDVMCAACGCVQYRVARVWYVAACSNRILIEASFRLLLAGTQSCIVKISSLCDTVFTYPEMAVAM